MNRNIEVGCLCVMIGAVNEKNIGLTVKVISRQPGFDHWHNCPAWEIEGGSAPLALQKHLLRIDDYTEETETQEEELVV